MTPSGINDMGGPPPDAGAGPDLVVAIGKDKGSDMGGLDCVPLSALNMPDDQEQMQAPEQGDKVTYSIEGTVEKIEGDEAYVKRESINGQPVQPPSDKPEQPPQAGDEPDNDEAGMAGLEDMAKKTQLT